MSEKIRILNMLKDGNITAEEAEALLNALESTNTSGTVQESSVTLKDSRGRKPKKLRIVVDANENGSNKAKVNVTIPLNLLKTLGPLVKKSVPANVHRDLENHGVNLDEIFNAVDSLIESGLEDDIVNIDADGEDGETAKVRIYVE